METTKKMPLLKKVLAVDDSDLDLLVVKMIIQKNLFAEEVVIKKSARSALDYLLSCETSPQQLPQLILLDINMPELTGFDFLDEYDKLPEVIQQNCIIMMLSTSMDEDDHTRALNNKYVSKFISKPLDREKLDVVESDLLSGQIACSYVQLLKN